MDKNSKLYCKWADRGLALHNSGGALLCCHSRTFLNDEQGKKIFWHSHSLKDAWNSPTRRDIQQALENGIQHPNCDACWEVENSGGQSRRTYNNTLEYSTEYEHLDTPLLMDLKLGNLCNLACRTCNPSVSSRWYRDWWEAYDKHNTYVFEGDYNKYLDYNYLDGKLSYSIDNEQFWADLRRLFPYVHYVDIYGAEPMMIERLFDVLEHSVEQGIAKKQSLHFNTNGTLFDPRKVDLLCQFKELYVDVSIDGLYKQYDYTRYGETWEVTWGNLQKWRKIQDDLSDQKTQGINLDKIMHLSVCVTFSIFNIYYLDELFEFFDSQGYRVNFNEAHTPDNICVKILPNDVKQKVAEKLLRSSNPSFIERIKPIIGYMMEPRHDPETQDKFYQEFFRATRVLDERRKQDFASTFPEYYELIKDGFGSINPESFKVWTLSVNPNRVE